MADIALTTAAQVSIVESIEQLTAPASEAITPGAPVRFVTSTGYFANANATTAAEGRIYGIATGKRAVAAGETITALRIGVLDGFTLAGDYGSSVYVSDTDARLADAPGVALNIPVGLVVPGFASLLGVAADKMLAVNLSTAAQAAAGAGVLAVTHELLAASVDTWAFVADRSYRVIGVREAHSVVGGSGATVRPRKITAATTAAPGASVAAGITELTTAAIGLETSVNVAQTATLTATDADRLLAVGDKIGLDFAGTLTGLVGQLTIFMVPV